MKIFILNNNKLHTVLLVLAALFVSVDMKAQTYTTIANGAWSSSSTWSGGNVPPTNGTISSGMVINIKHMVTYSGSSISNSGTINISNPGSIAPGLQLASGISITNNSTGVIKVSGGELRQYRFSGGGESGTAQTGSFTNNGGKVYITNGFVEMAQNWTNQSGGTVVFNNASMEIGGAYNLNNSSTDSIIATSISVGMQGSGNFSVSGSAANAYYDSLRVEVASTTGSFTLQGGTVNGSIDFITLENHVTGTSGTGQITAVAGLQTSGLTLKNYCVPTPSSYVPNGKFSGSQTENCSLSYFPAGLMSATSTDQLNLSTDPKLKSGTALSAGAVYRYENVKPGMDAVVTIDSVVNGLVINNIDDNTGANAGYMQAFQPIMTSGPSAGYSYAVFTFNFVVTGTSTASAVDTAHVTALDIDGQNNLYEFDQLDLGTGATAGYLSYSPAITLTQISPGVFKGMNADAVSQPGVDTSARGNMFTATNYNITSFTAKLGMRTSTGQQTQRLFSLYTMNFLYPVYNVLPVTLESFTAIPDDQHNQVDLNWTAANQSGLSHYVVERSVDGTNYTDAGIVMSDDMSTQSSSYSFSDNIAGISQNIIYYRLCEVGLDGAIKYSEVRVVRISQQPEVNIAIVTYPNPVVNRINITIPYSWQNKKVSYELYGANGQRFERIDEANASQTETIDVNNLRAGLYLVRVNCEGQTALQKIIKY